MGDPAVSGGGRGGQSLQLEMKSVRLQQTESVFLNTKQIAEDQRELPEERHRKRRQSWILKLCCGLIILLLMDL